MVFKKRRFSKRRFRFRRRRYGARRLKKFIKRTVARMSELKYATVDLGQQNVDSATIQIGEISFVISQGSDRIDQRIGDKIKMKCFQAKFNLALTRTSVPPTNPPAGPSLVRLTIFHLKSSPSAVLPSITDVFNSVAVGSNYPNAMFNTQMASVIYDKKKFLGYLPIINAGVYSESGALNSMLPAAVTWTCKRKQRNNVNYSSAGVTLMNDVHDRFYYCICTSNVNANFITLNYSYAARLSYYDL